MSKRNILLSLSVIFVCLAIWKHGYFLEWNYNRKWRHIPEFILNPVVSSFEMDCSGFFPEYGFSRLTQVKGELPKDLDEEFSIVTNAMTESFSKAPSNFDLSKATPYFFKCKHDQYLLVWYMENYGTNREAYVSAVIDSENIWRLGWLISSEKRKAEAVN